MLRKNFKVEYFGESWKKPEVKNLVTWSGAAAKTQNSKQEKERRMRLQKY